MQESIIKDKTLAPAGKLKIDWVKHNMPVLSLLEEDFRRNRPFVGLRVSLSIHLEAKTAYLALVLAAGGAKVSVTGSNPLSTKDDVVAALAETGVSVYAIHGASEEAYKEYLDYTLSCRPHIVVDDGGDLVHHLHEERKEWSAEVLGACEETTAGVIRAKARERDGRLLFPVVAVNDADCKHLFDNRYGTGESALEGIMRATNLVVSGKTVVIAGYGWCGKGCAQRASWFGARVIVTEIDPVKALEAVMDGFMVLPMDQAAPLGDIFLTVTGCRDVLTQNHFKAMKDGVILANAGHFFEEIDLKGLAACCSESVIRRENVRGYRMTDGRWINVLGEGRLVNIVCGDGHPAEIMDMSFALQAVSARYVAKEGRGLKKAVIPVPEDLDKMVARLKLSALGVGIDALSDKQKEYLSSFKI